MTSYNIVRPYDDLPPSERKVFSISNISFVNQLQGLVSEIFIKNDEASATATISLNSDRTFTLPAGGSHFENNIVIESINITGITTGYIIVHYYKLSTLKRYGAIESD